MIRQGLLCILGVVWLFPIHAFQGSSAGNKVRVQIPIGLSGSVWRQRIPGDNPLSAEKIALGRELYFAKLLSIDGTISCATCHDPALAFTDSKAVAVGGRDQRGTRNAPTILNAVFNEVFFWDGRARSLEDQAKHPLLRSSLWSYPNPKVRKEMSYATSLWCANPILLYFPLSRSPLNPFLFENKVEGALIRLSSGPLLNITSGGGQTALLVL